MTGERLAAAGIAIVGSTPVLLCLLFMKYTWREGGGKVWWKMGTFAVIGVLWLTYSWVQAGPIVRRLWIAE